MDASILVTAKILCFVSAICAGVVRSRFPRAYLFFGAIMLLSGLTYSWFAWGVLGFAAVLAFIFLVVPVAARIAGKTRLGRAWLFSLTRPPENKGDCHGEQEKH